MLTFVGLAFAALLVIATIAHALRIVLLVGVGAICNLPLLTIPLSFGLVIQQLLLSALRSLHVGGVNFDLRTHRTGSLLDGFDGFHHFAEVSLLPDGGLFW